MNPMTPLGPVRSLEEVSLPWMQFFFGYFDERKALKLVWNLNSCNHVIQTWNELLLLIFLIGVWFKYWHILLHV